MNLLKRLYYHGRCLGGDVVWLPLVLMAGFALMLAGSGPTLRDLAVMVWAEIVIPGAAGFVAPLSISAVHDPSRSLINMGSFPGWRVSLERLALLIALFTLFSLVGNSLFTGFVLGNFQFGMILWATGVSFPVIFVLTAAGLWTSELFRSPSSGGVLPACACLFFLLAREMVTKPGWRLIHLFAGTWGSVEALPWNRLVLVLIGLTLLSSYLFWQCQPIPD